MTRRLAGELVVGLVLVALVAWGVNVALERLVTPRVATSADATGTSTPGQIPHITATLYYGTPDGQALVPVVREVPLAEGPVAQGRAIVAAQLEPAAAQVSVIPPGTTLRAFFLTERGDAFVDLSREVSANHPGGTSAELLTISAIVNAVTTNLPTVERVQILIDGREADTLAGHVDLRRPMQKDLSLVRDEVQ